MIRPWNNTGKNTTDVLFCQQVLKYKLHANFYHMQINLHQITICILFYVNECSSITSARFQGDFSNRTLCGCIQSLSPRGGGLEHLTTPPHLRRKKVLCLFCTDFLTFALVYRNCPCVNSPLVRVSFITQSSLSL